MSSQSSEQVEAPGLSDAVSRDRRVSLREAQDFQDCTACRLIGSGAFGGLGVYTWISGSQQLRQNRAAIIRKSGKFNYLARRTGIGATAAGLIVLSYIRFSGD